MAQEKLPTGVGAFGGRIAPTNPRTHVEKAKGGQTKQAPKTDVIRRTVATHPNNRDTLGHFSRDVGHQADHYVRSVDEAVHVKMGQTAVTTAQKVQ